MTLNNEQKQQVAAWVRGGLGLAEVQRRLESEFGLRPTFMEVRFLVDDLDLELADPVPPKAATPAPAAPEEDGGFGDTYPEDAGAPQPSDAELEDDGFGGMGGGSAKVAIDPIQRPGAVVSGSVTFSDGETMGWQLDQMGRLGLLPGKTEGYRPSEADIAAFQMELQSALQRQGF